MNQADNESSNRRTRRPNNNAKGRLVGNRAGQPAPAWKPMPGVPQANGANGRGKAAAESRIFLSRLPIDVAEKEVEELFSKTVGPVKDSFLVYNSQGLSKGMAVVTFHRPGDALIARARYDGKVVDGRRPIRIEILMDGAPAVPAAPAPKQPPSLLNRLAPFPEPVPTAASVVFPPKKKFPNQRKVGETKQPLVAPLVAVAVKPIPPRKPKIKKGPKRLKKRAPATVEDLDAEMEDYRAKAPGS
ncbi:hypothetical protein D9619_008160 [Psilocybe cf. subviscida]|uniref:RRM domain-containing protein n=1 Tax=Psilocybe cf. subviscida TaxID=2480587 RepID=A0A8H5AV42_9AGAR|nr:hypothetical protein D9619_008160 [Psilocybe cf. subviscida]